MLSGKGRVYRTLVEDLDMSKEIEMVPVSQEELTPEEYLEHYRDDPSNIQSVRIRPAQLGGRGFGALVVDFRTPVFRSPVRFRGVR